jgi:MYXO-CTERM domain-containing protein
MRTMRWLGGAAVTLLVGTSATAGTMYPSSGEAGATADAGGPGGFGGAPLTGVAAQPDAGDVATPKGGCAIAGEGGGAPAVVLAVAGLATARLRRRRRPRGRV